MVISCVVCSSSIVGHDSTINHLSNPTREVHGPQVGSISSDEHVHTSQNEDTVEGFPKCLN